MDNIEMIDKKDYIELVQTIIDKYNKLKQSRAQKYALIQYDDYDIEDDTHFTDLEFEMRDDDIAIKMLSNCITDIKKLTGKFGIEIASKQIKDTFNYKWYNKEYTDIPREYRMYYIEVE